MSAPELFAELPPINLPEFSIRQLNNGMTLLAAEQHEQPVVFFVLMIKAGAFHDPPGKSGLADVLVDMLAEGTRDRDSIELAKAMDSLGGRFSLRAEPENIWVEAQALSRRAGDAFDLLVEMVQRPAFQKKNLVRVKHQHRALLRTSFANPDFVGSRHLYAMLYGRGLPPGRFPTDKTLRHINQDDLWRFYKQYFVGANAILAAIGDADKEKMLDLMESRFRDWPGGEPATPFHLPENFKYPAGRRLVIKKGLTQAAILLGGPGVPQLSRDYEAFFLANHVLGASGFASRLMDAVRSKQGKTYGIHSSNNAESRVATFEISTFTRNEGTLETIKLVQNTLRKAVEEGLSASEVAKAKSAVIGRFPLRFESPGAWAHTATHNIFLGRPADYTLGARERIQRATLEQVNNALRSHVNLDQLSIVIVGDPKALKDRVHQLGPLDVRKERDDWY